MDEQEGSAGDADDTSGPGIAFLNGLVGLVAGKDSRPSSKFDETQMLNPSSSFFAAGHLLREVHAIAHRQQSVWPKLV